MAASEQNDIENDRQMMLRNGITHAEPTLFAKSNQV